jgi:hypothetical protein
MPSLLGRASTLVLSALGFLAVVDLGVCEQGSTGQPVG